MNIAFFIARAFHRQVSKNKGLTSSTNKIVTAGIAFGIFVMLLSVSIAFGFKQAIEEKMQAFAAPIEIVNSFSTQEKPLPLDNLNALIQILERDKDIDGITKFSSKIGVLKTKEDFQTICLKGFYDLNALPLLQNSLVAGKIPNYHLEKNRNSILISQSIADKLGLKVGDRVYAYFFEQNLKMRRFTISGIYQTYMDRFDDALAFAYLPVLNKINGWEQDACEGINLSLKRYKELPIVAAKIDYQLYRFRLQGINYTATTITEKYAQVFNWLGLLDMNILVILILMLSIAIFTMVSGVLILILERTSTVGILKALGMRNRGIRWIFLYHSSFIIIKGLCWGNIIALALIGIQNTFHLLKLDPEVYYIENVPMALQATWWIALNVGALVLIFLTLFLPVLLINALKPAKTIKFE